VASSRCGPVFVFIIVAMPIAPITALAAKLALAEKHIFTPIFLDRLNFQRTFIGWPPIGLL
jgi:hypothetical protein